MDRLLVIGGISVNIQHWEDRTITTAGGAGMYAALAARRCGAQVTVFSPRLGTYPEPLQSLAERLSEWLGPVVPVEQMPATVISRRQGAIENYTISQGAQAALSPAMLPDDLSAYDLAHVIPLASTSQQLAFMQACRQRGVAQISACTRPWGPEAKPEDVRAVMAEADLFFMTDREARTLFGSLEAARTEPGKLLCITNGPEGTLVIQGETAAKIPPVPATFVDPAGLGDTHIGATLASLLQGHHPLMAVQRAEALAAEMLGQMGLAPLLSGDPPPEVPLDPRVRIDEGQVQKVANKISTLSDVAPYPFVSPELPPVWHPEAVDYFFAATLQQFSFWTVRDGRYDRPLMAKIGGVEQKGSDYLWDALTRQMEREPGFCSPARQAELTREELRAVFRSDDGEDAMPALDLHLEQANAYGRDMLALQLTPQVVLQKALTSAEPLQTFLAVLDRIGGYKEDPLRKKSLLLALILHDRPECFFPLEEGQLGAPIMDYHLLRSCLRVGLVDVVDEPLRAKLRNREVISPAEEWAVRYPAYQAMRGVGALSGRSSGAVDGFFFQMRKRCPEMTEPECHACQLDPVCVHRKELFQPVLRTAFY